MAHPRFLPVTGTSSRNGYGLDDEVYYNRERTTLRALHDQGLLTVSETMISKPHRKRTLQAMEAQYVATTKDGPMQSWVVTKEAYRVMHPFHFTEVKHDSTLAGLTYVDESVELDTAEYPLSGAVKVDEITYYDEVAEWPPEKYLLEIQQDFSEDPDEEGG